MKLTLRVVGSPKMGLLEATGSTLRLGRDPECEIALGDKFDSVSWRHAKIVLSAKGIVLTDLESTNGTFVNDKRLQGAVPIKKADHIRLGHAGPTLEVVSFDLTPSADAPRRGAALPETEPYTPASAAGGVQFNKPLLAILVGAGGLVLMVLVGTVGFFTLRWMSNPVEPEPTQLTDSGSPPPNVTPPDRGPGRPPDQGQALPVVNRGMPDAIKTIFQQNCVKCHGPEVAKPKGKFGHVLDVAKLVQGKQIVPKDLKESELYRRITLPPDDEEMMPPMDEKGPLPPAAVAQIKQWIEGMKADGAAEVADSKPPPRPPPGSGPSADIAQKTEQVLKSYCYECHGLTFKAGKLDVTKRAILVTAPNARKGPYVTPGDVSKSYLWRRLGVDKDMPPAENKQPSPAERALVEQWIKAGAPAFPTTAFARKFISEQDVLAAVAKDLRQNPKGAQEWPYQRYFSLVHLHNNKEISDESLALYRAGLSKLINSLSRKARLVLPQEIDESKAILRIDTRDLDWDRLNLWQEIVRLYPYALRHDHNQDPAVQQLAEEVYRNASTNIPVLRADWFIANASVPPLYHTLLQIPTNARALEQELGVNVVDNFMKDKLVRAGFRKSGVSTQNRLVERHEGRLGFYWKSYDFKAGTQRGDLTKLPLGPNFNGNPFRSDAFDHDGGEIVFALSNGLQGYMLVNGTDERINDGPVEVVSDPNTFAGDNRIKNGLSCMGCHQDGMRKDFADIIRTGNGVVGKGVPKIQALYVEDKDMKRLVNEDEARFLAAVKTCTEPYLKGVTISLEPITALAKPYLKKDLNLSDVALELGMTDTAKLKLLIENNQRLRYLGLGPLADGNELKREKWEELTDIRTGPITGCFSTYQQAALELRLGEPTSVARTTR